MTLVDDRAKRALSITLLTFPPIAPGRLKTPNTAKKNIKQAPMMGKAQVDWHICRLQVYQHLFQVKAHELRRVHL